MRYFPAAFLLFFVVGCSSSPKPDAPAEPYLFGPASMRIHPIFTQPKDWTGDGKVDGIEALLEFQDQFADPTKATGQVIFELFEYRPNNPDPRGTRVLNPWIGQLATVADQREHWDRTSRSYSFPLAYPRMDTSRTYVLTATFERTTGGRFFDRIIIEPQRQSPQPVQPQQDPANVNTTAPATQPGRRTPAP